MGSMHTNDFFFLFYNLEVSMNYRMRKEEMFFFNLDFFQVFVDLLKAKKAFYNI